MGLKLRVGRKSVDAPCKYGQKRFSFVANNLKWPHPHKKGLSEANTWKGSTLVIGLHVLIESSSYCRRKGMCHGWYKCYYVFVVRIDLSVLT